MEFIVDTNDLNFYRAQPIDGGESLYAHTPKELGKKIGVASKGKDWTVTSKISEISDRKPINRNELIILLDGIGS